MKKTFCIRSPRERRLLILSAILAIVSLALVAQTAEKKEESKLSKDEMFYRFIDVASEVYQDIEANYVEEIAPRKVLEGALRGMFLVLDEHSQYMDSDTLSQLEKDTEGEFSGIGIHIALRQGVLTVVAPIPGSPAARVGLQPWDRIIEIEGESTESITLQEAVKKLTGPPGTKVSIKIYREGEAEPLPFTISRQTIKIDSVHSRLFEEGIGYVRLAKFSDETSADMRKAITDLTEQGMKALILDMRFNTGGLLREAIAVSELFVPKGELIVSTKGRMPSQNRQSLSEKDPIVNMPVFVLVNEGTASASEIVSGAIQDHHLGVIIGPEVEGKVRNTFGKGSVQTIGELKHSLAVDESGNPLPNAFRLTTAKYYTPSGRSIHHKGIAPDIAIAVPKGFQGDLMRHGMIGDPSQIEPGTATEDGDTGETGTVERQTPEPEESPAEPRILIPEPDSDADPENGPTPTPDPDFYKKSKPSSPDAGAADKVKDSFRDIMLEEAIRQMKVYMILQQAQNHREGGSGTRVAAGQAGDTTQ